MPHARKKTKKTKKTIEAIASAVSLFHITVDRAAEGFVLSVCGVNSISEFSDECVLLELSFSRLKISGERLDLTVYEQSTVEIRGKINSVEFSYDKA